MVSLSSRSSAHRIRRTWSRPPTGADSRGSATPPASAMCGSRVPPRAPLGTNRGRSPTTRLDDGLEIADLAFVPHGGLLFVRGGDFETPDKPPPNPAHLSGGVEQQIFLAGPAAAVAVQARRRARSGRIAQRRPRRLHSQRRGVDDRTAARCQGRPVVQDAGRGGLAALLARRHQARVRQQSWRPRLRRHLFIRRPHAALVGCKPRSRPRAAVVARQQADRISATAFDACRGRHRTAPNRVALVDSRHDRGRRADHRGISVAARRRQRVSRVELGHATVLDGREPPGVSGGERWLAAFLLGGAHRRRRAAADAR